MKPRLNEKNPLTKHKRRDPYYRWQDISKKTGLDESQLVKIAKMSYEELTGSLRIITYLKIKNGVGVDLLDKKLWE